LNVHQIAADKHATGAEYLPRIVTSQQARHEAAFFAFFRFQSQGVALQSHRGISKVAGLSPQFFPSDD